MGAHSLTASDMAAALLGKRRVEQTVLVIGARYNGTWPRYEVLVTPARAERGEKYFCGKHALKALQDGTSPEELELELAEVE